MKRLILFTGITIYALFAISSFVAIASENETSILQVTAPTQVNSQTKDDSYVYILAVADGRVVVKDKQNNIIKMTDTMVSILPQQDRERLSLGIKVKTKRELDRLLEDFCS